MMTEEFISRDVAEVVHEGETTQIIDGCCTACGAFMDCCEAAEYKFCPFLSRHVGGYGGSCDVFR